MLQEQTAPDGYRVIAGCPEGVQQTHALVYIQHRQLVRVEMQMLVRNLNTDQRAALRRMMRRNGSALHYRRILEEVQPAPSGVMRAVCSIAAATHEEMGIRLQQLNSPVLQSPACKERILYPTTELMDGEQAFLHFQEMLHPSN